MSCGSNHTIAMTSDGLIYGWGLNNSGQTGVGKNDEKCITTPFFIGVSDKYQYKITSLCI